MSQPISIDCNSEDPLPNNRAFDFRRVKKKPVVIKACVMDNYFAIKRGDEVIKGKPGDVLAKGVSGEFFRIPKFIYDKYYREMEGMGDE